MRSLPVVARGWQCMGQAMRKSQLSHLFSIFLSVMSGTSISVSARDNTHKPVAATDNPRTSGRMIAESEHRHFTLGDDHEYVHPTAVLCFLVCRLPEVFTTKHALLGPGCSKERQLLVRDADVGGRRVLALVAPVVVLLCLPDYGMRQIVRKPEGGSCEGRVG